jgi:steroid delta-isomerase-like uncharacterized protein
LWVTDEIFATDFAAHDLPEGFAPDRDGLRGFVKAMRTAFPDLHFDVLQQVGENDLVVNRWRMGGTNQGEFQGRPASGKAVRVEGVTIHRIGGGQIKESWTYWDETGMRKQLESPAS